MNKWFISIESIDWTKLWWVVGIITVFWSGLTVLTVLYPSFDRPWKLVNILLTATVAALLFAARGGKFVKDRSQLPPQDGKP